MTESAASPSPCPESRAYRNRDLLRGVSAGGSALSTLLAGYLLSRLGTVDATLADVSRMITDQGHQVALMREAQDGLHRELDQARREIDARLSACEVRSVAHGARLDELARQVAACEEAVARVDARRRDERSEIRRQVSGILERRGLAPLPPLASPPAAPAAEVAGAPPPHAPAADLAP